MERGVAEGLKGKTEREKYCNKIHNYFLQTKTGLARSEYLLLICFIGHKESPLELCDQSMGLYEAQENGNAEHDLKMKLIRVVSY